MTDTVDHFGTDTSGAPVSAITIHAGHLSARILTRGAILQAVHLSGLTHSLTLGSDNLSDYEGTMAYFGALVGPVANRIAGARAAVAGQPHQFEANERGTTTLHSGATGTHAQIWTLADAGTAHATLTLALPHGLGGFPGNRRLTARFEVLAPATLRLTLDAETDAPTLMNLANHSYWNLDGTPGWEGHRLQIAADRTLEVRPDLTLTGTILPVADTGMDFRTPRTPVPGTPELDTNFCLAPSRRALTDVLTLTGTTGTTMTIATTEPGLQVYDGRAAIRPGHGPYEGFAIEPQFWPDAPANPGFPPITLDPGQPWRQITEWRFARATA